MEHWTLTEDTYKQAAAHGAGILRAGDVIVYPTDTLYGLGADARNREAVARIVDIKGTDSARSFLVVVADVPMAKRYVVWPDVAEKLARAFLPGALSLILPARDGVSWAAPDGTIGIRIPNHPFSLALARALDGPIVSTSVNKSGVEPLSDPMQVATALGSGTGLISCVFDAGVRSPSPPSTIVRVEKDNMWHIIRVGAISEEAIRDTLI